MTKLATIFSLVALALGSASLPAADTKAKGAGDKKDLKFVQEAAQGGMYEVQAGELAQKKGTKTKDLGAQMIKDHSAANEELKQLATTKGITLPTTLDSKYTAKLDKLSKADANFDSVYLDAMEKDHKTDITLFENASKEAADADLKGFAAKTLPTLKMHLEHVQQAKSEGKTKK